MTFTDHIRVVSTLTFVAAVVLTAVMAVVGEWGVMFAMVGVVGATATTITMCDRCRTYEEMVAELTAVQDKTGEVEA